MNKKRLFKKLKERLGLGVLHLFFLIVCFLTLIPILYALSISLNVQNSLLASNFSFLPKELTIKNYMSVLMEEPVLLWFKNTLFLVVVTIAITLLVSVPAAYSLSRYRFTGRKTIITSLVLLYSFPAILSMFAVYKLFSPLGLINSKIGLIIVYSGTMVIFAILNLKGYFDSIPKEIEEAAQIDGANGKQMLTRVLMPLARPAIIVVCIMILIYVWNEYIYAITFMTGESNYTLAAGLYSLQATEMTGSWTVFAAASLLVSLPVLIIFYLSQKYMTSGLTAGGVKG